MAFTPASQVETYVKAAAVLKDTGFEIGGFSWIKQENGLWSGLVLVMVYDGTRRTFDLAVDIFDRTWREATSDESLAAI